MNILEVIYSLGSGGAETLVCDLCGEFRRRGHQVTLLLVDAPSGDSYAEERERLLEADGVRILRLNRRPGSLRSLAGSWFRLAGLLRRERFDVYHTHLLLPDVLVSLAARAAHSRTPQVGTLHNTGLQPASTVTGRLLRFCHRRMRTVFCSRPVQEANSDDFPDGICIPNGVADRTGSAAAAYELLRERGIETGNRRLLLSVGSLAPAKNREVMLRGMKLLAEKHPDVLLLVCGGGPSRQEHEALIRSLRLEEQVRLLGVCSRVPDLLEIADLYVSTSNREGMPIAVLEALRHGVPAILSPIGPHETLARKIGGVESMRDNSPESFCESVQAGLRQSEAYRRRLADSAEALENYSIGKCADRYLKLFASPVK